MKNENQITVNMENLSNEEREQLLKLVEKSNEQQPKKRWRAEDEEDYYFIDYCNKINTWKELNYKTDEDLYEIGNYFKTEEEAEFFRNLSLENQKFYNKYYLQYDNVFNYNNIRDFAVIAITEDEVYNLKNNYYAEWVDDLEKDRLIIFNRLFSLSFYTGIFSSWGGDKDALSDRLFYDIVKDLIDKYGDDIRGFILVPLHLCFFYSETVEEIKNDLKIMLENNKWHNLTDSIFIQRNYTDLNGLGSVIYKPNFVKQFDFNQLLE